jgi:HD superfamily phosphohydrolase YqeK
MEGGMRRRLELSTAVAGAIALVVLLVVQGSPAWAIVAAFGFVALLGENTAVLMHQGAAISPGFMIVMAAIAVSSPRDAAITAALVGACNGLYLPYLRQGRFGNIGFNCGQYLLASTAGAVAYVGLAPTSRLAGALVAAVAYGVVNTGFVLPYVALKPGESARAVWHDMKPAMPNYLSFGLLGLLVGLVCKELGPVSILLLAVPMVIGRLTFRSFEQTREAHEAALRVFVRLIEAKDPYTAGHTGRVAKYAVYIAEELHLDPDQVDHLRASALMHDVGKLAVPGRLLNKPGRLTEDEWQVVRRHNEAGIGILGQVDFMRTMALTASDTHGRFDAGDQGMPTDLVLEAHIVAVADAFDAMTSTRPYRQALDQDVAFTELRAHAGTQFNPDCVEALILAIEHRGERYGLGHEHDVHPFRTTPPVVGVGSAGLGDLEQATQ